jgi:acylphosphatase
MSRQAKHIYVSGHVQGVSYRESARQEANRLGVTGWVKNLADGRVELKVEGEAEMLDRFLVWLHEGTKYACVMGLSVEEHPLLDAAYFTVQR